MPQKEARSTPEQGISTGNAVAALNALHEGPDEQPGGDEETDDGAAPSISIDRTMLPCREYLKIHDLARHRNSGAANRRRGAAIFYAGSR
jgi:hypothetical protein